MKGGNALATLQNGLAKNAAALIGADLIDLKTLISTIQTLESAQASEEGGENAEQKLQAFLRGEAVEPEETQPEGLLQ